MKCWNISKCKVYTSIRQQIFKTYDFEEAPLPQEKLSCLGVGECALSRVTLTAADADHILRTSRLTGNTSFPLGRSVVTDVDHSDFLFIHPLLFGLLMSVYNCPGELRRVLTQNWVNTWGGWTEASAMIESASLSNGENRVAE